MLADTTGANVRGGLAAAAAANKNTELGANVPTRGINIACLVLLSNLNCFFGDIWWVFSSLFKEIIMGKGQPN